MNTFAVVFFCIQVCLVQNVFSQCAGAFGPAALAPAAFGPAALAPAAFGPAALAPAALAPAAFGPAALSPAGFGTAAAPFGYPGAAGWGAPCGAVAPYGGAGEGNVAVFGELPVAGSTVVAGQVPIMGAVGFSGPVPAIGSVSISGRCACGCNAPYVY